MVKFTELPLRGAFRIELQAHIDERGFFARSFCAREFEDHGLKSNFVQCNVSYNEIQGTLRGMHFQVSPFEEAKLVRCTSGAFLDVLVDLRSDSPTYRQWVSEELNAENRTSLYIPEGFAHGFQTLCDNTEIFYQMSEFYAPQSSRGFRYDDPSIGIRWALPVSTISPRDQELSFYEPFIHGD